MKKGGLTAKVVESKLREFDGNLAAVGRSFGVTRQAVWDFIQKRPTLLAAANDVRESMLDEGEASLQRAVKNGESWAVCFYLKTQAKKRGYIEKDEQPLLDKIAELERRLMEMESGDSEAAFSPFGATHSHDRGAAPLEGTNGSTNGSGPY